MIHPTLRLQTLKLCELGYCFTKIKNYCEKPTTGLMTQAFKQAIQKELQEFYRLLAVIQEKVIHAYQLDVECELNFYSLFVICRPWTLF